MASFNPERYCKWVVQEWAALEVREVLADPADPADRLEEAQG